MELVKKILFDDTQCDFGSVLSFCDSRALCHVKVCQYKLYI